VTRALVTGANGHLGSNLVRELLDKGWDVVPFVRVTSHLAGLDGLDVRVRYGDILDPESLDAAMVGCQVVFHAAAVYRNWAKDPNDILTPALEGTRHVIEAAAAAGVERVIHTSSCNTVGFTDSIDRPRSETDHNDDPHMPYIRAKVESEALALRLGRSLGMEVVVLCPTGILGPHDHRTTPTMEFARGILNGGPVLPGGQNLVHVRDVAHAHVLAATRGTPGERYLIGGENVRAEELIDYVQELTGRRPKVLKAPFWVLFMMAWVMETVARLRGGQPALTPDMVRDAHGRSAVFDTSKAEDALGYRGRPGKDTLEDTLSWFEGSGQLAKAG